MSTGVWRRFSAGDRLAVAVLTTVAAGMAILPTAFGRPLMNGDNLEQNYPLRVLVGEIVRDGHAPLWNSFIWSGTPLLAGWNAGAAFPGTWLFAIIPDVWAWTINLLLVGLLGTIGVYVFLRRQAIGPTGAFIGSATFSFTGFMSGQSNHLGLVLGTSLLPFALIGVDEIARRLEDRPLGDVLAPALVVSASGALVVLAGEPRAISSGAIVVGIYALAWCWRSPARAGRLLLVLAAAGALALALSAVQWLPGIQFLRASERGGGGYPLFSIGSLKPSSGVFFLLPYLLGGYGNFGLPVFAGPLNLPELSFGIGILPLVAFVSMLPAALRRHSRLGVWYVLAVVGVVLSLGTNTPVGHVLWHLPLFGGERLQNRNIVITDLALSVIMAYWADRLATDRSPVSTAPDPSPRHLATSRTTRPERLARWASVLPAVAVLVIVAVYLTHPIGLERWVQARPLNAGRAHELLGYLIPASALAVAVGAFALLAGRLSPLVRHRALVVLAVAEIAFLAANGPYALAPKVTIATTNPETAKLAALTGPQSRYGFYDPNFLVAPSSQLIAQELGFFDLGILHNISSVQGYGSIVSQLYENATASHQVGNFDLQALAGTTANVLDLHTLLTSPHYLAQPIPNGGAVPVLTESGPRFDIGAGERVLRGQSAARNGPWFVLPGTSRTWFLPGILEGASATLVLDPTVRPFPKAITVAFVDPQGRSASARALVIGTRARAVAPAGFDVAELRVSAPTGGLSVVLGGVVVANRTGSRRLLLDGILQTALSAPHWRFAGMIGPLPAYTNTESRGPAWVVSAATTEPDAPLLAGSAASTAEAPAGDPMQTVVTSPGPALLVRSTAFAPDWYVSIQTAAGGPANLVPVPRARCRSGGPRPGRSLHRHVGLPAWNGPPRGAVDVRRDARVPRPVRTCVVPAARTQDVASPACRAPPTSAALSLIPLPCAGPAPRSGHAHGGSASARCAAGPRPQGISSAGAAT